MSDKFRFEHNRVATELGQVRTKGKPFDSFNSYVDGKTSAGMDPSRTHGAAPLLWQNSICRNSIYKYADKRTLAVLTRLNHDSFLLAIRYL